MTSSMPRRIITNYMARKNNNIQMHIMNRPKKRVRGAVTKNAVVSFLSSSTGTLSNTKPSKKSIIHSGHDAVGVNQLAVPFSTSTTSTEKRLKSFIPRKAPVNLTPKARQFFKALLDSRIQKQKEKNSNNSGGMNNIVGILLQYQQSKSGEPRMVFTFDFVTQDQIGMKDESVSLEVIKVKVGGGDSNYPGDEEEEIPKPPQESFDDGLPKLYIHEHAFMKVLGCTIDLDTDTFTPILYDREGNVMDPNN